MVQKVITLCDVHQQLHTIHPDDQSAQDVLGAGQEISLNGRIYAIDLCPECVAQYVHPLFEMVQACGRVLADKPPEKAAANPVPGTFACPSCTFQTAYLNSFRSHLKSKHGLTGAVATRAVAAASTGDYQCPVCEIRFRTESGLRSHQSTHTIDT